MKLIQNFSLIILFATILISNQCNTMAISQHFANLIENMKLYQTTNSRFHAGHLYEHSIWVTRSIINLLESRWPEEIDNINKLIKLLIISGLLHDIGKGGDLEYIFFEKKDHPSRGFDYILEFQPYFTNETDTFSFKKLFEELNFSENERKFVAIMAGMHHELGTIMRGPGTRYNTRLDNKHLCEKILKKLDHFIQTSKYMGGNVNRKSKAYKQLVCCICLISAADVCGAQVVCHNREIHNIINKIVGMDFSEEANIHSHSLSEGFDAYNFFAYKTAGFDAKNNLIKILISEK